MWKTIARESSATCEKNTEADFNDAEGNVKQVRAYMQIMTAQNRPKVFGCKISSEDVAVIAFVLVQSFWATRVQIADNNRKSMQKTIEEDNTVGWMKATSGKVQHG